MYDYTLAKNLARDLRNYHNGVVEQIAATTSPEASEILELLSAMNDELAALEKHVTTKAAEQRKAAALEELARVQAELSALE